MNKNIAIVITAVLLLGMGLITYNEYTHPTTAPFSAQQAENTRMIPEQPLFPSSTAAATKAENTFGASRQEAKRPAASAPLAAAPQKTVPNTAALPATAPKVAPTTAPKMPAQALQIPTPPPSSLAEAQVAIPSPAPAPLPKPVAAPPPAPVVVQKPAPVIAQKEAPKNTAPAVVEDPIQKALEASRKNSTLPILTAETAPKPATPAPKAPTQVTTPAAKTIKKISVATIGDGVTVRLDSTEIPKYKTMRLTSPERLVLDLRGTWKLRAPGVPSNAFVSNVRIGNHKEGTRIVIDLKKVPADIRYLRFGDTGLDVRLR